MHAADIVATIVKDGQFLIKMLGNPAFVGLVLMEQHYRTPDDPWLSVACIAERAGFSEDTVRRRLNELTAVNRVICRHQDSRREYRIAPHVADHVMRGLSIDQDMVSR